VKTTKNYRGIDIALETEKTKPTKGLSGVDHYAESAQWKRQHNQEKKTKRKGKKKRP
jgi:hypothetical protein